jgi:hypothetical protein
MSMWRVGREAVRITDPVLTPLDASVAEARAAGARSAAAGGQAAGGGPLGDIADTVAKWIPGDVLALYVAGVTMIGSPNWFWLVVGILLAPAVVVLAAFANSGQFPPGPGTGVRAATGFVAMLVWSLTVPGSGWQSWAVVRGNPAAVALAAGAIGLIFGLAAEGVSRWADNRPVAGRRPARGLAGAARGRSRRPTAPAAPVPPAAPGPAGGPAPQAGQQAAPTAAGQQSGSAPPGSAPPGSAPPGSAPPGSAPRESHWAKAGGAAAPVADPDGPTVRLPTTRRTADPQPMRMPSIPPD